MLPINYESNKAWQQRTRKPLNRTGTLKRTGVLARISRRHAAKNREYLKKKRAHLLANPLCAVCGVPATDLHHSRGRSGDFLTDERYFVSLCREHHNDAHSDYQAALKDGVSMSRHRNKDLE